MSMARAGRLLLGYSVAVIVALLGLALSAQAASQRAAGAPSRPVATSSQSGCGATWIRGITENRTGISMRVIQDGHGLTNEWCRSPEDYVHARSTDAWLAGDKSGDTSIHIVYLLPNGDKVLFRAGITKDRRGDVGCSFVEVVRTPREYECRAEVVASVPGIAAVRFTVLTANR
jgi:hypothetical protein